MKSIKIIALNEKAEDTLRKHLREKLSFQQKLVLKQFFKTAYDGKNTFVLSLKSAKLVGLVSLNDLVDRIVKEFLADGCSKSDFSIKEVDQ